MIKSKIEWILSWVVKLRLRKTYWSIAVPTGLFVIGEFAKKLDIWVKATNQLHESSEGYWTKLFWKAAHFYFNINLPWWSLVLIIMMLLLFTYVYLQELKAKKLGFELAVEGTSSSNTFINNIDPLVDMAHQYFRMHLKENITSFSFPITSNYSSSTNFDLNIWLYARNLSGIPFVNKLHFGRNTTIGKGQVTVIPINFGENKIKLVYGLAYIKGGYSNLDKTKNYTVDKLYRLDFHPRVSLSSPNEENVINSYIKEIFDAHIAFNNYN